MEGLSDGDGGRREAKASLGKVRGRKSKIDREREM